MTTQQKQQIIELIKKQILNKLDRYNPESRSMPFHYRLLGRDRMALYSFIQSLNTTFGTSIFEPVAKLIASWNYEHVEKQYKLPTQISTKAQQIIQKIIDQLATGLKNPDKRKEIELIRRYACIKPFTKTKTAKADLIIKHRKTYYLFDLKTVKPNINEFKSYKRTLLEWTALILCQELDADVHTFIAIPYNPYEPKPYERWTLKGMLDINNELLVGEEFWNFLGGKNTYNELLKCFEKAGIELRPILDEFFKKFSIN